MLVFDQVAFSYSKKAQARPDVSDISFSIKAGETLAIVGESGSGKTTIARMAAGFLVPSAGRIERPKKHTQMIFQSSSQALSPHLSVAELVGEGLKINGIATAQRQSLVLACLQQVGLDEHYVNRYSAALSGGQRQRVNIARAIITQPQLLIADEPLSALDVSVQAQICNVLKPLVKALNCAMLLVIHDLALARYLADKVVVLSKGRIVEQGSVEAVFGAPQHDYTRMLLKTMALA